MSKTKPKKNAYNKIYKDERRIVVYTKDADTKRKLAQYALDNNMSLSELVEPKLKELADAIR